MGRESLSKELDAILEIHIRDPDELEEVKERVIDCVGGWIGAQLFPNHYKNSKKRQA